MRIYDFILVNVFNFHVNICVTLTVIISGLTNYSKEGHKKAVWPEWPSKSPARSCAGPEESAARVSTKVWWAEEGKQWSLASGRFFKFYWNVLRNVYAAGSDQFNWIFMYFINLSLALTVNCGKFRTCNLKKKRNFRRPLFNWSMRSMTLLTTYLSCKTQAQNLEKQLSQCRR